MKAKIVIRTLVLSDFSEGMLDDFRRYQEVTKVYRKEQGQYVIKDIEFIESWNVEKCRQISIELLTTFENSGGVVGVYDEGRLIGFGSIDSNRLGPEGAYLQLMQLHISKEYRGCGIGKRLFIACSDMARSMSASKMYISAHSSIESTGFYRRVGCVDTVWLYDEQVALEPYDCQLEYEL